MVVRIGTSEAGGTFNLQGEALGKLLSGVMDAEILAFEGSSVANANRLHQGTLNLVFQPQIGSAVQCEVKSLCQTD